jgi:hypothetical protein
MKMEVSMNLDRYTARALVDANLMSLKEYIERFGTTEEADAGKADGLQVVRSRQPNPAVQEEEKSYGFLLATRETPAAARFLCH